MNNKELFEREYLCEWTQSESYKKAYDLWVQYQYECERFDEFLYNEQRDKDGFTILPNEERKISLKFAANKLKEIKTLANIYRISEDDWEIAKGNVNRLNLKGLINEYNRIISQK